MSGTNKRIKELRALAQKVGVKLLGISRTNGGHFRVEVESDAGEKSALFFSFSPSDPRAIKNFQRHLKHAKAGVSRQKF